MPVLGLSVRGGLMDFLTAFGAVAVTVMLLCYALESRSPPVLARLGSIFDQDWRLAGGTPAPLGAAGGPIAQTAPGQEIRRLIGADLAAARRIVAVEIFDITDGDLLAALSAARARAVQVRVLIDPRQAVNRRAYALLKAGGVEVRWYPAPPGTLLHAKVGLFDGRLQRRLIPKPLEFTLSALPVNHRVVTDDGRQLHSETHIRTCS